MVQGVPSYLGDLHGDLRAEPALTRGLQPRILSISITQDAW